MRSAWESIYSIWVICNRLGSILLSYLVSVWLFEWDEGMKLFFSKVKYNDCRVHWASTPSKIQRCRNVRSASFTYPHQRLQIYRWRHGYHADTIWTAAWTDDGGDEVPFPLSGKLTSCTYDLLLWKLKLTTVKLQSIGGSSFRNLLESITEGRMTTKFFWILLQDIWIWLDYVRWGQVENWRSWRALGCDAPRKFRRGLQTEQTQRLYVNGSCPFHNQPSSDIWATIPTEGPET